MIEIDAGTDYQTRARIDDNGATLVLETFQESMAPGEAPFIEHAWVKVTALARFLDDAAPGWRDLA